MLARATDRLVAVSPEVRDELVALGVASEKKFSIIRLGIELEPRVAFDGDTVEIRRRHGIPAETFVVGWFGRMTAVKRTDDLLATLSGLRERGVDALLLLVGDGSDRGRLEQRAHDLGIARALPVPRLPGGGRDLVRALRRRRPDVGERGHARHDHRGARRGPTGRRDGGRWRAGRRRRGRDGVSRSVRRHDAMADRLERLARDPELRSAMGAEGRERVLRRYAVERLVADVDELYRALLDETTSATSRR